MSSRPTIAPQEPVTLFDEVRLVAAGPWQTVQQDARRYMQRIPEARLRLFMDATGSCLAHDELWLVGGLDGEPVVGVPGSAAQSGSEEALSFVGPDPLAGPLASADATVGGGLTDEPASVAPPAASDALVCNVGAQAQAPRGPGRPRLGVVAREITLLPEHWDWLAKQPGGASRTIRKLVEDARAAALLRERQQHAYEVAFRVATTMAHFLPPFEDALLAIYAGDCTLFEAKTADWPQDLREYLRRIGFEIACRKMN